MSVALFGGSELRCALKFMTFVLDTTVMIRTPMIAMIDAEEEKRRNLHDLQALIPVH